MNQRANLFTKSGRLKGISYCRPSGNRRAMVVVSTMDGQVKIVRQFGVTSTDFDIAWQRAVDYLAEQKAITDEDVIAELYDYREKFLADYGLETVTARLLVIS